MFPNADTAICQVHYGHFGNSATVVSVAATNFLDTADLFVVEKIGLDTGSSPEPSPMTTRAHTIIGRHAPRYGCMNPIGPSAPGRPRNYSHQKIKLRDLANVRLRWSEVVEPKRVELSLSGPSQLQKVASLATMADSERRVVDHGI